MLLNLKSFKDHHGFMKYFKNTSWLFGERIFRMITGFFVGVWVARYLGPEKFGLISYAQSFVGLFTAIGTLGLNAVVIRELVKGNQNRDSLIGTAFRLKLIGSFGVLFFLAIAINFTSNDTYTNSLIFIIASGVIFQSFNVIDFYFQSKVLSKYVVYTNVISLTLSSIIKIILVLYGAPLVAFAWVILFDNIILALGLIYFYLNDDLSIKSWNFDKVIARSLMKDSWPLMLSTLMISIYAQLDQIMLKNMIDSREVGIYSAANKLNSFFYFIPSAILASFTPAIISAKEKSKKLFLDRLQNLYDLFVLYSYLAIIFVIIMAHYIILGTYGVEFEQSIIIFKIIVFSNIFSLLGAVSSRWYINTGFETKILHRNLFGVLFNLSGNLLLIPYYGAIGAAITTILSQVSSNILFDLFDSKTRIVFVQKRDSLILKNYFIMLFSKINGR